MMSQKDSGYNGISQLYHCGKPGGLQQKVIKGSGYIYNACDGDIAHRRKFFADTKTGL